jgi:uncharacterized protein (TIGR02217 family)
MTSMFHDVRLPEDIEVGAVGGPRFSTGVTSISSGAEQRNVLWDRQRLTWQLGYGIQDKADYAAVLAFFYARRGRGYGFRFRDFSDYVAEDQVIGTGDGSNRVFRLKVNYTSGGETYARTITHPVVDSMTVKVDGVEIDPADYDVEDLGIVRFHSGHAPGNGLSVTWSGEFDVPVRFDTDDFNITLSALAAGEIESNALPVTELREQLNSPPTAVNITTTYFASIDEFTSTASRIAIADFEIVDDDLGVNVAALTGANPTFFEVELDADTRSGTLYITAGASLDHAVHASLSVSIDVWDSVVGVQPSAQRTVSLTVNEVNHVPTVVLTNETHNVALAASTVSRTHLADISATANLGQLVTVTLTGADASHFELFGGNLYLKAGEDTSTAIHYDVTIHATDAGGTTDTAFVFTIGVVAATHLYDTVGSFTLVCPLYNTLTIEVQAAGCATWGYSPGSPTPPTAPGRTYVQNDQTVTVFHRWRVEATRMADNTDAWTPGYTIPTATQASLGIGAALAFAFAGIQGGVGIPVTIKDAAYDAPSGQGGYALWDSAVVLGGASVKATAPVDDTPTTANGLPGTVPGAGASGGVYKKSTLTVGQIMPGFGGAVPPPTINFTSLAGAASGMFARFAWTYGTAQVGSGAGYTAPAPAAGDVLTIVVGPGGVAGAGLVNGADGGHGRVRITVA